MVSRKRRPLNIDPEHQSDGWFEGIPQSNQDTTRYLPMWVSQQVSIYQEVIHIIRNLQFNNHIKRLHSCPQKKSQNATESRLVEILMAYK